MITTKQVQNVNAVDIPFKVVGGLNVHQASLVIDTNQTAEVPGFVLFYPNDTIKTLAVGTTYDDAGGASGYCVLCTEVSGVYTLDITMNPNDGNPLSFGLADVNLDFVLRVVVETAISADISVSCDDNYEVSVTNGIDLSIVGVAGPMGPKGDKGDPGTINASSVDVLDITRPIGSPFDQYPGMADPNTLFPGTTWTERFADEGIVFRTPGGKALAFDGGIQEDAIQFHDHEIRVKSDNAGGTAADGSSSGNIGLIKTLGIVQDGSHEPPRVDEESRHRNRTFRVWERTA